MAFCLAATLLRAARSVRCARECTDLVGTVAWCWGIGMERELPNVCLSEGVLVTRGMWLVP